MFIAWTLKNFNPEVISILKLKDARKSIPKVGKSTRFLSKQITIHFACSLFLLLFSHFVLACPLVRAKVNFPRGESNLLCCSQASATGYVDAPLAESRTRKRERTEHSGMRGRKCTSDGGIRCKYNFELFRMPSEWLSVITLWVRFNNKGRNAKFALIIMSEFAWTLSFKESGSSNSLMRNKKFCSFWVRDNIIYMLES